MSEVTLSDFVEETAAKIQISGVAAVVLVDGKEAEAYHGMTSIENPLPIDRDMLFGLGSVSKTFIATTLLRLVAEGKVELEAPAYSRESCYAMATDSLPLVAVIWPGSGDGRS